MGKILGEVSRCNLSPPRPMVFYFASPTFARSSSPSWPLGLALPKVGSRMVDGRRPCPWTFSRLQFTSLELNIGRVGNIPGDSAKISGLAPQHPHTRTHALTGAAARGLDGAEGSCATQLKFVPEIPQAVIQIPMSQRTNEPPPFAQTHEAAYTHLYNRLCAADAEKCHRTNQFRTGICSSVQLSCTMAWAIQCDLSM